MRLRYGKLRKSVRCGWWGVILYCGFLSPAVIASFVLIHFSRFILHGETANIEKNVKANNPASDSIDIPSTTSYLEDNPNVITKSLYTGGHSLLPRDVCHKSGEGLLLVVIVVTSAPSHLSRRNAIRSTWGTIPSQRADVDLAFIVGTSRNQEENETILKESLIYGDIIQGRFIDTYNNLTLKTISILEWTVKYCNRARYLLKTDDDMLINFPVMLRILNERKHHKSAIIGEVVKHMRPVRNETSKHYVSLSHYKADTLPVFNAGCAYVITGDLVEPLYEASLSEVFFKLEDVYITGIVAPKLKVTRLNCPEFWNRRVVLKKCVVEKLATVQLKIQPDEEMSELWNELNNNSVMCAYHN